MGEQMGGVGVTAFESTPLKGVEGQRTRGLSQAPMKMSYRWLPEVAPAPQLGGQGRGQGSGWNLDRMVHIRRANAKQLERDTSCAHAFTDSGGKRFECSACDPPHQLPPPTHTTHHSRRVED